MYGKFIWRHKFKFLSILIVIFWYVYTRHYSDTAVKYRKFESVKIGMDSNQVNRILGKPEYIYFHKDDSSINYSYHKDVGLLVDMVIKFDPSYHVIKKWVR